MYLVTLQLRLFGAEECSRCGLNSPKCLADYEAVTDAERDRRTGSQWLKSIRAYLEFASGCAWRRITDPAQRSNPEYLWYLNGIRALNGIGVEKPVPIHIVKTKPQAHILPAIPRADLVDRILRISPSLSNRKLLLHLSREKLIDMLCCAQANRVRPMERAS